MFGIQAKYKRFCTKSSANHLCSLGLNIGNVMHKMLKFKLFLGLNSSSSSLSAGIVYFVGWIFVCATLLLLFCCRLFCPRYVCVLLYSVSVYYIYWLVYIVCEKLNNIFIKIDFEQLYGRIWRFSFGFVIDLCDAHSKKFETWSWWCILKTDWNEMMMVTLMGNNILFLF